MTMKLTQITTYWDAGEAHTAITFLENRRDVLWATYGEQIIEMQREAASKNNRSDGESLDSQWDDEMTF